MAFGWDDAIAIGLGGASMFGSMSSAKQASRGVSEMNASNERIARENREWQERMSNTAHSREVKDLREAGLNPILSATGGSGASSPGGSMIPMQSTKESSSLIKSQSAKLLSETLLNRAAAQTEKTKQVQNVASAKALGGNLSIPGFGSIPIDRLRDFFSSKNLKSVTNPFGDRQTELKKQGVKTWFN